MLPALSETKLNFLNPGNAYQPYSLPTINTASSEETAAVWWKIDNRRFRSGFSDIFHVTEVDSMMDRSQVP